MPIHNIPSFLGSVQVSLLIRDGKGSSQLEERENTLTLAGLYFSLFFITVSFIAVYSFLFLFLFTVIGFKGNIL